VAAAAVVRSLGGVADVRITRGVSIPEREIELRFARSGGPGGRKVDTASTRVELRFDLDASQALSGEDKARVRRELGHRLTRDGVLVLRSSEYRTQGRNRQAVRARFQNLLRDALRPARRRKPTRRTPASKERRLEAKRRRSEKKRLRKPPELPPR
jgi:ribosome-associated protein